MHRIGRVGRAGREGVAITLVEPREHHALRNIERLTNHKIEIAKVPTVADLQARRLDNTIATLREVLAADDIEHFRVVVDSLSNEYDVIQIAMAAVKLYHLAVTPEGGEAATGREAPREEPRRPESRAGGAGTWRASTSRSARRPASARRISSARSRTRPESPGRSSAPSRPRTGSRWSRCPRNVVRAGHQGAREEHHPRQEGEGAAGLGQRRGRQEFPEEQVVVL